MYLKKIVQKSTTIKIIILHSRDRNHHKESRKIKVQKKPPHAISNRALNNVVSSLGKSVERSTNSQDDGEEPSSDDMERYVNYYNNNIFTLIKKTVKT